MRRIRTNFQKINRTRGWRGLRMMGMMPTHTVRIRREVDMQPARFDNLVMLAASTLSRRGMLRAAILAVLGALGSPGRSVGAQIPADGSLVMGDACSSSAQCEQRVGCGVPGSVICADNGMGDGASHCCANEAAYCGLDSHCCAGLVCIGAGGDGCGPGKCRRPGDPLAIPLEECSDTVACSQLGGPARCVRGLVYDTMRIVCCRDAGGECGMDEHCCGTMSCRSGYCASLLAGATRTTTDDLILREQPSIEAPALALIPAGSTVTLAEQGELYDYTSVYWDGLYGWVLKAYLV
jgi:hypothetical protein